MTVTSSHLEQTGSNYGEFSKTDLAKLVGVPPPPPSGPPPRKSRRSKHNRHSIMTTSTKVNTETPIEAIANDTKENVELSNLAILNDLATDSLIKENIETTHKVEEKHPVDSTEEFQETITQKFLGLNGLESPESFENNDSSFVSYKSHVIDIDDFSMSTEISRSVMATMENQSRKSGSNEASLPSLVTITTVESESSKEGKDSKASKKQRKGGFLKKIFGGRGKGKSEIQSMMETLEGGASEESKVNVDQNDQDIFEVGNRLSQDPPDDEHSDDSQILRGLTVDVQPRNLVGFEAEGDPVGQMTRILSTKAKAVPAVKIIDIDSFEDELMTNLRVLDHNDSVDPLGTSFTGEEDTRGRPANFERTKMDPIGQSPKQPWLKRVVSDPVGESPTHGKDSKKEDDTPLENVDESNDIENTEETDEASRAALNVVESSIVDTENPGMPHEEEVDNDNVDTPNEDVDSAMTSKKPTIEVEEEEEKALTISEAAFLNAQAVAYLHELHGEPSPRHTWHVKKMGTIQNHSPVSNNSDDEKVQAQTVPKEDSTLMPSRKKAPSPEEYSAINVENMVEDPLENKEISRFQGFAYRQNFKGRKPTKKSMQTSEPDLPRYDSEKVSLFTLDHLAYYNKKPNVKFCARPAAPTNFPSTKISAQAVAKNAILKCEKRLGLSRPSMTNRFEGRNRFYFNKKESELKNPIQKAGRRLLSKAAVQIQSVARMYLAKRDAVDRMWALLAIQSYTRRWNSEAIYHAHLAHKRNLAAIMIQKTARGYLAAARAYDIMYCIVSIQAMMRGAIARKRHAQYKEHLLAHSDYAVPMQALFRGFRERKELATFDYSACKIQSLWRSYSARINYQFEIVDIIVAQSVIRRWFAYKKVEEIKNAPFFAPASKIQAIVRGKLARESYHMKMGSVIMIQAIARQYVTRRKALQTKLLSEALTIAAAQELREKIAAKRIQFWWRIVLDWSKEKKAALVIERFFIHVRKEVEREVERQKREAAMRRRQKRRESSSKFLSLPMCGALTSVDETKVVLYNDQARSQSASRQRSDSSPYRTQQIGGRNKRMQSPSAYKKSVSFDDEDDSQNWPIPDVKFAQSDLTEISAITTPESLLPKTQSKTYERRQREKLSADDYIKKYNRTDSFMVNEPKSRFSFSEDAGVSTKLERVPSFGKPKVIMTPKERSRTPRESSTPRSHSGTTPRSLPKSPYHQRSIPPSPRMSSSGSRTPRSHTASPRMSSSGSRTPRSHTASPRMSSSGSRTPRSHTASPRMSSSGSRAPRSPYHQNSIRSSPRMSTSESQKDHESFYAPIALKRQTKPVIKLTNTIATESMSRSFSTHSAEDDNSGHRSPVIVMKKYQRFSPREQPHDIFVGDEFGEV